MPLQTAPNPTGSIQEVVFTYSQTFTPSFKCKALVYVIGGGGSGGSCWASSATVKNCSGGGGAGGTAVSVLTLDPSVTYTATIGDGGAGSASPGNALNGNDGGNSEFSGTGIATMIGNGGSGGVAANAVGSTASVAAGGAGGTASGGNQSNITGGSGGTATLNGSLASGVRWK